MVYVLSRQSDWKQDDTKRYYLWWRCWLDQKQRQTPASLVVGRLVSVLGPVLLVELFIVNNYTVNCWGTVKKPPNPFRLATPLLYIHQTHAHHPL
jgi:hypothetical protein